MKKAQIAAITIVLVSSACQAITWVSISETGFAGKMSKYETTNAQYCQFLNSALASGDITISGSSIVGANGSNSGADYVGRVYYSTDGPGLTAYGATNGGAARIHESGGMFTVDSGYSSHPVTYVTWYGAMAFCNYYGYRLPTIDEWRAVADYDGSYTYGCGTSIDTGKANYIDTSHPDGTFPVGSFGSYGYGLCDLAGNVHERTNPNHALGGGWSSHDDTCAVSNSLFEDSGWGGSESGFRVCRDEDPVNIPDTALKAAIESALGISDPTCSDLATLTSLDVQSRGITDLTGVECATNLIELWISHNPISNLSPISSLPKLEVLESEDCTISNVSPLSGISTMKMINLFDNQISNVSPLGSLTGLTSLELMRNSISNISSLSGLTQLNFLSLRENNITDISAIAGFINLDTLLLQFNPLSCMAYNCFLPQIQANNPGIVIQVDPMPEPCNCVVFNDSALESAVRSALGITAPCACVTRGDMLTLTSLDVQSRGITDLTGLECATNLIDLWISHNPISNLSPLSSLPKLEVLEAEDCTISNVSPLSGISTMKAINLFDNTISNVCPLGSLTGLTSLELMRNNVNDICCLSGLTQLTFLSVRENNISGICCLTGLKHLYTLLLQGNPLRRETYCGCKQMIEHSNPGIVIQDDGICIIVCPDVSTYQPINITASSAGLKGFLVDDGGESCEGRFRYWIKGQQFETEKTTAWRQVSREFGHQANDLLPGTAYCFVAEARNSSCLDQGDPKEFTTQVILDVSFSVGCIVQQPGKGSFSYDQGTSVPVQVEAKTEFTFLGWTGTAVDAGKVSDPSLPETTVLMDGNYTLRAQFLSIRETIYVDSTVSNDPNADGDEARPFDSLQEAVEVAQEGTTIFVNSGTYIGPIRFSGRDVVLTGEEPEKSGFINFPVIDANNLDTAVTFTNQESTNCVLRGFVITGGLGQTAGAILCQNSSPTIQNCLIVGNRSLNADGGAVVLIDANGLIENCTIADNYGGETGAGIVLDNSSPVITNCIVWNNLATDLLIDAGSSPVITYSDTAMLQAGLGNMTDYPEFYMTGYWGDVNDPSIIISADYVDAIWVPGDYHLVSETGRWDTPTQMWIPDSISSPCIDAGDPNSPWTHEYEPNGGRINLGAYGHTQEASLSNQ